MKTNQSDPNGQQPRGRWDINADQYDQMIRYAIAIRTGTASTEVILRRFTKADAIHRTYLAVIEVGRAQKTVFVARQLRRRNLQREINEGLDIVESWNQQSDLFRRAAVHWKTGVSGSGCPAAPPIPPVDS